MEDHAAAASLERELSSGVAAQDTVIQAAAAAQETEPTADANDAEDDEDCVIVEAKVITPTPLNPVPCFLVGRGDNPLKCVLYSRCRARSTEL